MVDTTVTSKVGVGESRVKLKEVFFVYYIQLTLMCLKNVLSYAKARGNSN